jgi:hypothetical protein
MSADYTAREARERMEKLKKTGEEQDVEFRKAFYAHLTRLLELVGFTSEQISNYDMIAGQISFYEVPTLVQLMSMIAALGKSYSEILTFKLP